jgi:glycine betaine/proline transport system substrate-binding protein
LIASAAPTKATAYPESRVVIGANKAFTEVAPELTAFLRAYSSTNAATSSALAFMRDTNATPDEAAANFLKSSEDAWTAWVPADVAERVKSALSK